MRQPFPIQPIRTGDRQIDGFANATRQSVADLYTRVPGDGASRIIAPDDYTQLYWPCDEDTANGNTVANRGRDTSGPLLVGAGSMYPNASAGLVARRCVRAYGSDATRAMVAATAGPTYGDAVTISCVMRLGDVGTIHIGPGYFDHGGATAILALYADASGRPLFYVRTAGGLVVATGTSDMAMSAGHDYFLAGTYDGATATVWLDGNGSSSGTSASAINWTYGGTRRWGFGYAGAAESLRGLIQEVRVDNCTRGIDYIRSVYAAGMGLAA